MTLYQLRQRLHLTDRRTYRLLEMMPGVLVWITFVGLLVMSFAAPLVAIIFILVFDLYWLIRVVYMLMYHIMAFRRIRHDMRVDWMARLDETEGWKNIFHVVIIPTYKEPLNVLQTTFRALDALNYPHDRMMVVLATEERDAAHVRPLATALTAEFGTKFQEFLVSEHPDDIPGEIAGKGANIAWAGHRIQERLDQLQVPYPSVMVSTFDADTVPDTQYLAAITWEFLHAEHPLRSSYQPVPVFNNNVWEALPFARVVANSTTFWLMGDAMRPDRLWTFSSHSMPFQALVDVGFWQTDVVSEDSRIFLQCFLRYDGDYRVVPIYLTVSMDTIQAPTWWESMKNQYKQIRRWAYGAENFPFMVWHFFKRSDISRRTKFRFFWNQIEGTYSWATAPMIIFILGWLPFQVDKGLFNRSILVQNAPAQLQQLMAAAMVGLIVTAIISSLMLPTRPAHVRWWHWIAMVVQWVLLPVTMIVYGSVPAVESQTRLMLGKYLGFWVTAKDRTNPKF